MRKVEILPTHEAGYGPVLMTDILKILHKYTGS